MSDNPVAMALEPRELLDRVASSAPFQRSKRLRELLQYLGERALKDPTCTLREQEIGVDVLGRPSDYDTSHDTLVRVLVSQLRKKLQEYFATEGRDEPVVIEIPKGSYLPVFRLRELEAEATVEALAEPKPGSVYRSRKLALIIGAAVILVAATVALAAGYRTHRSSGRPMVEAFWTQLFGNGQSTYLVLSDVSLMDFENLMGQFVPLSEYEGHEFDRLAAAHIPDPARRAVALSFVSRITTAMSDVLAAREFGVLANQRGLPLTVINARDLSSSSVSSVNTVLLGSWRSDPWVGLFESELNFGTVYQETPPAARFVNRHPRAGEQASYAAEWRRTGYCRVAFLANPRQTGNVLLISGTDVISSESGVRFATSEAMLADFRKKLGVPAGSPMPHFEALLRAQIVNSTTPWFALVAWRKR